MIVNPGIRRFLGSAIQRLFNGAAFALPLTHTAVPTRGSITPSFTRATTETGQKYDEAGYLDFTALAGEVVWKGARRVRNLLLNTGWAGATTGSVGAPPTSWTTSVATGTTTVSDSVTYAGHKQIAFTAVAQRPFIVTSASFATNSKYVLSVRVVTNTSAPVNDIIVCVSLPAGATEEFLINGVVVASSTVPVAGDIAAYRVTTAAAGGSPTLRVGLGCQGAATGTTTLVAPQLEDVTGQTTQTASEYVSVGVESAPAYHGSMVDGVKCYDTDRSGNPISTSGSYPLVGYVPWEARTNMCLQSNAFTTAPWAAIGTLTPVQNAIGPDGATSAWTFTDDNAAATEARYQPITLTAATYTMHVLVGKTTGAQSSYPVLQATDLGTKIALCTVDTTNGVATVWTAYTGFTIVTSSARCESYTDDLWKVSLTFLATAAAWYHYLQPAATANATQATGVPDAAVTGSAVFCNFDVELGSFATPYIPTTTVAVARNANLLTYTGADVANIKTLAATFSRDYTNAGATAVATLTNAGASQWAYAYLLAATSTLRFQGYNGATQWEVETAYTNGVTSKIAWTQATNDVKFDKDGTALTQDTSAAMPVFDRLQVGHLNGSFVLNGPVNHIYGWTRNMSQSELGAIDA